MPNSKITSQKLKEAAYLELARRELAKRNPITFWQPQQGPQTLAFQSKADVIGFGGSAGGGKSDLILGLAFEKHVRSLILRWEASQASDFFERALEIVGDVPCSKSSQSKIIKGVPPNNKYIHFGGIGNKNDVGKWNGRPHDFLAFDEATEFPKNIAILLMTWVRSTIPGQHCQTLMTFNPPTTAEGMWVIEYFAPWLDPKHPNPALPGELRYYATIKGKEVECKDDTPFHIEGIKKPIRPLSRTFFPARVEDNKYLNDTDYVSQLQNLPEPFRSQFLFGDFHAAQPADPWQVIPTDWLKAAQERWKSQPDKPTDIPLTALGVDVAMGGNDKTVIAKRYGSYFTQLEKYAGTQTKDSNEALAVIETALLTGDKPERRNQIAVNIDGIGVGAGVVTSCKNAGLRAKPIIFSEGTKELDVTNNFGFANVRALAYWRLREALDPVNGDSLALPDDPELFSDLTVPRFSIRASGIQVEPKEDIKRRIGRSPDCGDAVVLAHYISRTDGQDIFDFYKSQAESLNDTTTNAPFLHIQ